MKKIIALFFVLINVLLFFGILDVYERKDALFVNRMYAVNRPDVLHKWIEFENNDRTADSKALFALFRELTERYDLLVMVGQGDFVDKQYNLYFSASGKIDQRLDLVTDVSVNFNESDDYFYTNDKDNTEGIFFYLICKGYDVNIYPMTRLSGMPSTTINFYAGSQADMDACLARLTERFGDHIGRLSDPSGGVIVVEEEINKFLPVSAALAILCVFLLLMMYVQTRSKKIAIFKTMGVSFFTTSAKLFLPLLAVILLSVALTNAVLFSAVVGAVNRTTVSLMADLAKSALYQLAGVVLGIALSCVLFLFVPAYSLLKNSRLNRHLMHLNFALKIIVLITLVPLASGSLNGVRERLAIIRYSVNPDVYAYQFVSRYQPEYEIDGYDYIAYMGEYHQNYDPDFIYAHEMLYEYHRAYQILNEAGAIFCRSGLISDAESVITVNENYLKKYPVKDLQGNRVDIHSVDADVVYLVPEYYDYLPDDFYLSSDPEDILTYEKIVIGDRQDIFNFNPIRNYNFLQRPHIIVVYKDTAFRWDASIFGDVYIDADINELLKDTWFHDKIIVRNLGDWYAMTRESGLRYVLEQTRFVLPTLALLAVISIQYAYLYLKVFAKQIFVRKLLGHPPLWIFGRLLVESTLTVAVALAFTLYRGTQPGLLLCILGLDLLVYLATVFFSRRIQAKYMDAGEA